MRIFRVLWEWSWFSIMVAGFLALILVQVGVGCSPPPPRTQPILSLKCYSGGKLIVDREVVKFSPGSIFASTNSYWDFEKEKYVSIKGLDCIVEATGEKWTEE